jgi:hypothetical protein
MSKKFLLLPAGLLSLILLFLHLAALKYSFYWLYPWYDIAIHAIGGAAIGLLILFILWRFVYSKEFFLLIISMLILVSVVGLVWEFFEFSTGLTFTSSNYPRDTFIDISMTSFGGVLAFIYGLGLRGKLLS